MELRMRRKRGKIQYRCKTTDIRIRPRISLSNEWGVCGQHKQRIGRLGCLPMVCDVFMLHVCAVPDESTPTGVRTLVETYGTQEGWTKQEVQEELAKLGKTRTLKSLRTLVASKELFASLKLDPGLASHISSVLQSGERSAGIVSPVLSALCSLSLSLSSLSLSLSLSQP
jgi:hypothetical protein